ncbi:MAG: hypothetical protein ACRDZ6_06480 [Acidimicrobiales bacterium]
MERIRRLRRTLWAAATTGVLSVGLLVHLHPYPIWQHEVIRNIHL